jgi:tetratricopeptide (TPR) repeat protein
MPLRTIHPNLVGGLLAALLPLQLFALSYAIRRRNRIAGFVLALTAALGVISLLMTSSRAAWFALLCAVAVSALWSATGWLARRRNYSQLLLFSGFLAAIVVLFGIWASSNVDGIIDSINRIPGHSTAVSRLALFEGAVNLIPDFLLTGGGLHSFPGLYSEYILISPFFIFGYAHNMYLDLVIEQGILGLAAALVLLIGSLFYVSKRLARNHQPSRRLRSLRWGAFAGLIVILVHGLLDDPFYGMEGTPLLLALAGLALTSVSLQPGLTASSTQNNRQTGQPLWRMAALTVILLVLLGGALYLTRALSPSTILANLGAVKMAKAGLVNWPTGKWDSGENPDKYNEAKNLLLQSIRINPAQPSALYRLGLVSVFDRDYAAAAAYLERALALNPDHPGIIKSLGMSYVWLGRYQEAVSLIGSLEDTAKELAIYQSWWLSQGRQDLSERAKEMLAILESGRSRSSRTP